MTVPRNRRATSLVTMPAHGVYEESATREHELGSVLFLDGNEYRYAKASEALSPGKLATVVVDSDREDTVTVAHGIGTRKVTVTAASAITANQYQDGFLVVNDGTGAGRKYCVESHPAIGNGETGEITLKDPLDAAWAVADTDVTLYTSMYVVQESNTGQKECPMGVPEISVTSGYYFWLQVRGFLQILTDEVFGDATNGRVATIGSSTAGSVEAQDAQGETIAAQVYLAGDTTDAEYHPFVR